MKGIMYILFLLCLSICFSTVISANDRWQSGLDTTMTPKSIHSIMSLDDVLALVATHNPSLRSLGYKREAANNRLLQAGLRPNPEFSTEFEEVGWDAPGLSESEITISLSQEFEFFGQRNARKQIALTDIKTTEFENRLAAFDLYLDTKSRFNKVLYFQRKSELVDSSVNTAEHIFKSIENRMKQGVALQSELLLSELELQRFILDREETLQELHSAQLELMALWHGKTEHIQVTASDEPNFESVITKLPNLLLQIDSTRNVLLSNYEMERTDAEKYLASVETKPGITFSGGYKRIEANNSNSLLFGISLPLPLFNKNEGKTAALDATIRALEYDKERTRLETKAYINSAITRLNQLVSKHKTIDNLLLPTAKNAYESLKKTYNVGRIPYTSLLEAERSLNQLRFDHNDVLFAIY